MTIVEASTQGQKIQSMYTDIVTVNSGAYLSIRLTFHSQGCLNIDLR